MALIHMNFFSDCLGMSVQADVILPQRTQRQIGMQGKVSGGKHKVLWLLHGASDDHTIWQRRTSIERYVAPLGIAVVMPNAHLSSYTNMAHGGRFFDYIADELPRICRSFFPLSEAREDNFIAGLSMGGYGCMKIGLSRPENYAAIGCFSAGNFILRDTSQMNERMLKRQRMLYGDKLDQLVGSEHDLHHLADEIVRQGRPAPRIFHCIGDDDFCLDSATATRQYFQGLAGNPFDYTYKQYPGVHDWDFWDAHIREALDFFGLKAE
ncbi:MAG: alpha/beta hydrolase [Christensenellales bacterium]|jgi:putative tributyrin esterase